MQVTHDHTRLTTVKYDYNGYMRLPAGGPGRTVGTGRETTAWERVVTRAVTRVVTRVDTRVVTRVVTRAVIRAVTRVVTAVSISQIWEA